MSDAKEIVRPFYTDCLTVNTSTNVAEKMGQLLADNFQSKGSVEVKSKAQLIGQIQFFWQLVPDLKWEIQEMAAEGNKVVVRSLASGTPNGNFMGVQTDGSKSFKTMTIDIHTVENGQVVEVHHLEDWATAIKQLSA
ncbi:MAG: ester cyclase [Anaerolineales bacterium]